MALVMIGGSLVAGSTPMGGGTVAFPALVLGFQESPAMARDFGLAIQSVGMTSALLFILLRRIPVESRLLAWGSAGYGNSLKAKGEVSMTLQLPVFWVPYVLAVSCGLVVLITLYHMLHPGKELMKP